MKKHQFVKQDCNCLKRATYFTCKHCGTIEYCGIDEIRTLPGNRAACSSQMAPDVPHAESFKCKLGGTLDCLAPDYATWDKERKARGEAMPNA